MAKPALELLLEKPDDPEANLVAGRFTCFLKNHWQQGLPMLVNGKDEQLKALAKADLENPQDGKQRAALAQRWEEISDAQQGRAKKSARDRAIHHYKLAQGRLTGLSRARVDKKLKSLQAR